MNTKKNIRSISITESLDKKLMEDSEYRGLTISANLSRILFDYFQQNPIKQLSGSGKRLNILPTK